MVEAKVEVYGRKVRGTEAISKLKYIYDNWGTLIFPKEDYKETCHMFIYTNESINTCLKTCICY